MTQISDERRTDRELSDMIQSLLNHGEAGYTYVKIDAHLSALRELQSLRASIPGGTEVQCCMCGKTGLSTIEGDGGTECQLEDGRWTCSQDCYYTAVDWFSRPSAAPSNPVISDEMLFTTIQDAYLRGLDWGRKYSSTEAEELKASYDYADKTTAALSVKPQSGSDKP